MKVIKLTQGKSTLLDVESHKKHCDLQWYAAKRWYSYYAQRMRDRKIVQLHREIMNAKNGEEVDHINGDTLDNRKKNLRIVTRSQNEWNRGKQKNNTTGYKGVILSRGRYVARIRVKSKLIYLGSYIDKKEAAKSYNMGAIKYHGEFAKLNII